jgi:SAM-dependent methyltransferase
MVLAATRLSKESTMQADDADTSADASVDYADTELLYNQMMEPALAAAIGSLGLTAGSCVLDAGCGPGGVLPLLCAAVAPGGGVLGLDISEPHVATASELIQRYGLQASASAAVADLRAELPVAPAAFDAVWSADVLYPDTVGDPQAVVTTLLRALKPGGLLAVFYGNWLRPIYLPGYARLEHLICAAREAAYARDRAWQGEPHPERALGWLTRASCVECQLRLFPVVYQQPLPAPVRRYIQTAIFGGHYQRAVLNTGRAADITEADVALWARLSDPQDPGSVLVQPDYYCAFIALLAVGRKPA